MTTLEDLYYGNICPHEGNMKNGSKMNQLIKLICKNEESLCATLTEEQKATFKRFKDCQNELSGLGEVDAFKCGFVLAVRIMVEVTEGLQTAEEA